VLTVGDRPSEHAETGDVELGDDRVRPRLELGRVAAQHHLPVPDDDVLVHLVGGEHQRAHRLGDPLEAEAVLERRPHLREAGAAQRRLERRTSSANGRMCGPLSMKTTPRLG
jgi:hypothetical protein